MYSLNQSTGEDKKSGLQVPLIIINGVCNGDVVFKLI